MTRDEIIEMAQEAEIVVTGDAVWKLCELVIAAERERCAKVCEEMANSRYLLDDERQVAHSCAEAIRKGE